MTNYKYMFIRKENVIPLIAKLANEYNKLDSDKDYLMFENDDNCGFLLINDMGDKKCNHFTALD